uniref:Uncharacterized protein n=1 Tax=Anopheles minimus TaxID=112268 RepID=A0A182WQ73_9DIPT
MISSEHQARYVSTSVARKQLFNND